MNDISCCVCGLEKYKKVCGNEIYSKCSKISNAFHFLFANEMSVISAGIHRMLVGIAKGKILIRLLL